jgi:serine/threonine-protein kinase
MATVYLAEDTRHQRPVAVKVLDPAFAAALGSERFLREIRIAARLSHPHVVPLIDSGDAQGRLYYVSPYLAGGSLHDRLVRDGPLSIAEALRITREIGAGLDFVHRQGFIHRDIKPQNILFLDGHAMLADFGIARACEDTGTDSLTGVSLVVGTPEYMSPEQASGARDLTTRSDEYSLACVVYEMLTGVPPLRGENSQATMAKHVIEIPRPVRAMRPETPLAIERALVRALAKNPEERFKTVEAFVEALERSDEATQAEVEAVSVYARSVAVLPFVNASSDPENEFLSDGMTDELINALASVEGLRVASRTSVFALKGKPLDVRAIGSLLGATWVIEGTVRRAGDRLRITVQLTSTDDGRLVWSQRFDRTVEDVFALQEEIANTIVEALRVTAFAGLSKPAPKRYTDNVKAYGLYLRGRFAWNKRTPEAITQAIDYFERAIAEDPSYAPAYTGLADSYALGLDYRSVPVAEGFARAKAYARQALAIDDSLAEGHASLAWSLFIHDWDWEGAAREFERAIALDPRYPSAHQWHAFLQLALGRTDAALVSAHTAMELDPASVSIRRTVGWCYFYARRYEQARYQVARAVAMNPTAEESYRVLGYTLVELGHHDEAERVLREAAALPSAGPYATSTLGYALARAGRKVEARRILHGLEERSKQEYVSPVAFAMLHLGLEEYDLALDWTERTYEERRGWVVYFKVNPQIDPLRSMPRYQALVERLGLKRKG